MKLSDLKVKYKAEVRSGKLRIDAYCRSVAQKEGVTVDIQWPPNKIVLSITGQHGAILKALQYYIQ